MVGKEFGNNIQDVTDPTDWLNTPLSSFKDIDAALRCEVCKDFYRTPMITACSHTFCSLCIRRCLVTDGKCPTCRTSEQEVRLRSNWAMEGLVVAFVKARPAALEHVQKHTAINYPPSPKRNIYDADLDGEEYEQSRKRTKSSGRILVGSKERASAILIERDRDGGVYQPEGGIAACPICNTSMKIELVFPHLENCNGQLAADRFPVPTLTQLSTLQSEQKSFPKPSPKTERLAHLNYSLLRESALRKKLVELGIPSVGTRQQLERRHIEWVTLWNANCDSSKPRKKSDLLNELDVWEKTQGIRAPYSSSSFNTGSQVLGKDFDCAGWAAKHSQSFRDLIAAARRGVSKKESPEPSESEHDVFEGGEARSKAVDPVDSELRIVKDRPTPDTLRQGAISSCEERPITKHLPLEHKLDPGKDERLFRSGDGSLILPVSSQNLPSPNKCWREENSITGDLDITTTSPEAL